MKLLFILLGSVFCGLGVMGLAFVDTCVLWVYGSTQDVPHPYTGACQGLCTQVAGERCYAVYVDMGENIFWTYCECDGRIPSVPCTGILVEDQRFGTPYRYSIVCLQNTCANPCYGGQQLQNPPPAPTETNACSCPL